jgi:hypothetical protein
LTVCAGEDGPVDVGRKEFFASVVDAFLEDERASESGEFKYFGVAENLTSPF